MPNAPAITNEVEVGRVSPAKCAKVRTLADVQALRIAVIGCGSIGRRHATNLAALGLKSIAVFDQDRDRAESVGQQTGANCRADLQSVLDEGPDAVIIATPTQHHMNVALASAARGCHLFIEKPLSYCLDGVDALCDAVEQRSLIAMVACNMRFHPGPATVHRWLTEGAIGRPMSARVQTGSYLPSWRQETKNTAHSAPLVRESLLAPTNPLVRESFLAPPQAGIPSRDSSSTAQEAEAHGAGQEYAASYSAHPVWGGAILDCIHEIDLATWYLGPAELLAACWMPAASIGLETDGLAELLLRHESSAISSVHLNFVQRDYRRGCQIIGESGTIYWDESEGIAQRVDQHGHVAEVRCEPEGWLLNDIYVNQMSHFLHCVVHGVETCNPLRKAAATLQIALAARDRGRTQT